MNITESYLNAKILRDITTKALKERLQKEQALFNEARLHIEKTAHSAALRGDSTVTVTLGKEFTCLDPDGNGDDLISALGQSLVVVLQKDGFKVTTSTGCMLTLTLEW